MYKATIIAPRRMGQSLFMAYDEWLVNIQAKQNIEIVSVCSASPGNLIVTYKVL